MRIISHLQSLCQLVLPNTMCSLVMDNCKNVIANFLFQTRMHSSRMPTAHSLTVSCSNQRWGVCIPHMLPAMHTALPCMSPAMHAPHHACPPATHTPNHTHTLPCTPPATHAPTTHAPCHACPHHTCPLPCTSPAMHAPHHACPLSCMPPTTHTPCHTCPPCHACPTLWTYTCKNITFANFVCGR